MTMRPIDAVREMLAGLVGGPDTPFMERRAQSEQFAAAFVVPDDITIEPAELGGVTVEWVTPAIHTDTTFVHFHGGGYVLGNPSASRAFTTAFARLARCRVVSVDYRLAPECPFPAAVDDGLAAYRTLLAQGIDHSSLAIGGESAGGGLALAVLLAARDESLAMPASAALVSPWTDLRCTADSFESKATVDPLLTRRVLTDMADAYLAGAEADNPLASPLLGVLTGLPPLLVHVGSEEVLLDDSTGLVERAIAAGVDAKLEIAPDMIHVWHMFHAALPEGADALARLTQFVRQKWETSSCD